MDDIKPPINKKPAKNLSHNIDLKKSEISKVEKPIKEDLGNFKIIDNTSSVLLNNENQKNVSIEREGNKMADIGKPSGRKRTKNFNKKIFIIVLLILLLIAGASLYYFIFVKKDTKPKYQPKTQTKIQITETKPVSLLTGLPVASPELANRPITGIMIENSPEARPQSGLIDAGIVYEAVAEGGITRFLALYQDSQPQYIGPIRSARPYYIDFLLPFNGSLVHVGGSPDALNDIKTLAVRDLDQFFNGDYFRRITERFAPHNVYTSFDKLDELNKLKKFISSKFTAFERKKDVPQTQTASIIDLAISGPLYSPRFEYDKETNSYKRFQNGAPHIDEKSKKQITPKVIIVLVMDQTAASDGYHTLYKDTGSGKMYVFQDGIVSEGTWEKPDRKSQFILKDKNGLPIKLNAGQTWISIVGSSSDISYKP